MKKRTLPARLFLFLLAALGFSGCADDTGDVVMYGTPYTTYKIKASVTGVDGKPVQGIQISVKESNNIASTITNGVNEFKYTDKDGLVETSGRVYISEKRVLIVEAADVDGELNGKYARKVVEIEMKSEDIKPGNGWEPTWEKNVTIDLTK